MLPMVDLSNWTGPITANDLQGTALIAAKCTELGQGITFIDPLYLRWRALAQQIGARFAAYHFAHPNVPAADSWAFFAGHADLQPGDLYACDLETSDGLSPAAVSAWGGGFAHAGFGQLRAWPLAYSDQDFINAGNLDGMAAAGCPLWVAVIGAVAPAPPPLFPPFAKTLAIQYRDDVPPFNIDLDAVYLDSPAELAGYAVPGGPTPGPPLAPPPLPVIACGSRELFYMPGSLFGTWLRGTDVLALQRFIFTDPAQHDGIYGPITAGRVSWYEGMRGISQEKPYGIAGPEVWANTGLAGKTVTA